VNPGIVASHLTLTSAPRPVVEIISSSPGWLTPTIAVLGLVLALVSLGWQVTTFYWSGSRVRLQTKLAFSIASELIILDDKSVANMAQVKPEELRKLAPVVVVHNRGRLAVTVQSCTWHSDTVSMTTRGGALGDVPPHRLEAHARFTTGLEPANVTALFRASGPAPTDGWWSIWPSIELGNGKTVRGEPVKLPVTGDDKTSLSNGLDAGEGSTTSPS